MNVKSMIEFQEKREQLQFELKKMEQAYLDACSLGDDVIFNCTATLYIQALEEYTSFVNEYLEVE